jgi:predicted ABC-type ATPase
MNIEDIFVELVNEGIDDKNLFKAVVLCGGAGSGKTTIASKAFTDGGVKFVNNDDIFKMYLKKANLDMDLDRSKEGFAEKEALRVKGIQKTANRRDMWINNMLPIVIDGTGREINHITTAKKLLEDAGYDVSCLFVNTRLDVALKRNAERISKGDRKVDETFLKEAWRAVQANIGKFQELFGNKFEVVDNSETLDAAGNMKLSLRLAKIARKFLESPLQNKIGINKIKDARNAR